MLSAPSSFGSKSLCYESPQHCDYPCLAGRLEFHKGNSGQKDIPRTLMSEYLEVPWELRKTLQRGSNVTSVILKSTQIKVTRNSFRAVRCPAEMWLVMGAELATLFWDIDYSKLIIFKKRQTQEEALTCPLTARDPVPGRGRASQVTTVSYELVWQTSRSTARPLGSKSSLSQHGPADVPSPCALPSCPNHNLRLSAQVGMSVSAGPGSRILTEPP